MILLSRKGLKSLLGSEFFHDPVLSSSLSLEEATGKVCTVFTSLNEEFTGIFINFEAGLGGFSSLGKIPRNNQELVVGVYQG